MASPAIAPKESALAIQELCSEQYLKNEAKLKTYKQVLTVLSKPTHLDTLLSICL